MVEMSRRSNHDVRQAAAYKDFRSQQVIEDVDKARRRGEAYRTLSRTSNIREVRKAACVLGEFGIEIDVSAYELRFTLDGVS